MNDVRVGSITERKPTLTGSEILNHLVPPRQFRKATLDSFTPDPNYPSQTEAIASIRAFIASWNTTGSKLFGRRKGVESRPGIYLDGGFGVGKTHLLAALWFLAPGRKYFGTFIEYTALVGAVGYANAASMLRGASLICIDEFELDDPGDTRLMARLLGELADSGTKIAATSNTPPNALGEGRFAAVDFLREIDSLAQRFTIVRIDGLDFRRRATDSHALSVSEDEVRSSLATVDGETALDDFKSIIEHLATIHPSRFSKMVEGLAAIGILNAQVLHSQTDALRFVAFVDRLYDARVRIFSSGVPLDQVFAEDMLAGGYRKKYLRAASRLISLTSQDEEAE
ncbi:MAG: cell division protein ZapE [Cryobacterium sp.]|nr:cell division protein ZapE [Cryobacterium sp.]MBX3103575.1 cell division protein ZapE [Cryobacterium sp.]